MIKAQWTLLDLDFTFQAITSRERMWHRRSYLVRVWDDADPQVSGVGECGLFRGLSADDVPDYEERLARLCSHSLHWRECTMPSMRFGFETAFADLAAGGTHRWSRNAQWLGGEVGIPINGLVWMGDRNTMAARIEEKLSAGFKVLKLKIGGINFEDEVELLRGVRRRFAPESLEIRLDANGSFAPGHAMAALDVLSQFYIHSIEQPVKPGQPEVMARICRESPIPVALDEELIGWHTEEEIAGLLDFVRPAYVILKPSLIGGIEAADTYIKVASNLGIGWWATSALESNIGLNAIAQWVSSHMLESALPPQGLGTGQLYSNNIASPLTVKGGSLFNEPSAAWGDFDALPWR